MSRTLIMTGALLCAAVIPALADQWTKTFTVGATPRLRVETSDASVTVRPGAGNKIQARVYTSGWKLGPGEVQVTDHQTGDLVEIEVKFPLRVDFFNFKERWARIEVEVPVATAVDVHTGDGSIHAADLHGRLHLVSHDGSIEGEGLEGALDASSGDGHIKVRGKFTGLDLRSGDGGIEAEVLPGSRMAGSWTVHTGDGSVTMRLPDGFAADVDAHTGDGHITVDLPLTTEGSPHEHELLGKLNGGGAALTIHTGDGSLHLLRL